MAAKQEGHLRWTYVRDSYVNLTREFLKQGGGGLIEARWRRLECGLGPGARQWWSQSWMIAKSFNWGWLLM